MDELIRAAAGGDRDAFAGLVEHYQKQVYNLCLRMVSNPEDAADLAQEAFFNAWKGLPFFKFDAAFSTWLYRLTSNACIDFLRRQKRRKETSVTFLDEGDETKELELPDTAPGPEEQVLHLESQRLLHDAMGELEVEYRQALTLRAVQGLSYSEIAEVLDIKEGTVKSRIARAREKLRKKLLASGNYCVPTASIHSEGGRSV